MLSVLSVIAAMRHFSVVGGKRQAVENGNCDARYHKAQRSSWNGTSRLIPL